MLTLLYITNRGLYPLRRSPVGQYDLLAASLAVQVDGDGKLFADYEVVIVDRENPLPRREVEHAARRAVGGVRAFRPRATPWTRLGAFAPNAARNTGLCHARGDLVVGVDDCFELSPRYLWRCAQLHADGVHVAAILTQADDSVAYPPQPAGPVPSPTPIGGIFSYPLAAAVAVNGWDERYDGTSGGDVDMTWRLRAAGVRFVRHPDVVVRGHDHAGRRATHPRCWQPALALGKRRLAQGRLRANAPWAADELAAWTTCGRRERECGITGFGCEYEDDMSAQAAGIMVEYEASEWFDLAAARAAAADADEVR